MPSDFLDNPSVIQGASGVRILIIDDDDVDREMLKRRLTRLERPMTVNEACSSAGARAALASGRFDCVFLDYQLDDMVGLELVPLIRAHRAQACAIVMVSNRNDEGLVVQALREGVNDYISKNALDSRRLTQALESSLRWAELEKDLQIANDRLRQLSLYDALTDLPNRTLLFERLNQVNMASQRTGAAYTLLMMDLDLFKEVNDTLGHDAGDIVLAQTARRLQGALRESDTVARIGGDEFVCLLPELRDSGDAMRLAAKIVDMVKTPIAVGGEIVTIGISIGIAQFPTHGTDTATLLKRADQAMYRAKQGGSQIELYSQACEVASNPTVLLTSRLLRAIGAGELRVHFQPKIDLQSGLVAGKEALVRWQDPERGLIQPDQFIPAAERSTAIHALTSTVLELSLNQERVWRDRGLCMPVAVNISARALDDPSLRDRIGMMLEARRLPPECLIVELTETALIAAPQRAAATLRALLADGVGVSIDDFGAGYTSFMQLRHIEVSEIKIDRRYITDASEGSRDAAIVKSIAVLARGFNVPVVAEGVEEISAWPFLSHLGCRYAQGYSFAHPMAAQAYDDWLQSWHGAAPQHAL
jgi:diguanylate cyclase (GGDEF)-like protein